MTLTEYANKFFTETHYKEAQRKAAKSFKWSQRENNRTVTLIIKGINIGSYNDVLIKRFKLAIKEF